jgi:ADP-heptose:LPS heptosyltransferase
VSLQKEVRAGDAQALGASPRLRDFTDQLCDFSDTAALCDCLDLLISVDTSVAHLNAALGRKTWVLLPFNSDWRWLLKRDDSPWYPSMTLYRQTQPGSWAEVLTRLREDLRLKAAVA